MENQNIPGKSAATASMVLGIISIFCWFFGGMQTAGFVLSLIGLIGGGVFLISCIACVGAVGGAAGLADIANSLN